MHDLFRIPDMPDHHLILLDALEEARKAVCCYSPLARTCDCKYGLIPPTDPAEPVPLNAINCTHRNCEHTGCPEIRSMMAQVKNAQREVWGRRSKHHERTGHGWLCCANHPEFDPELANRVKAMYDGTPEGATCGGPGWCYTCTPEADRTHGLLPPLPEVVGDAPSA